MLNTERVLRLRRVVGRREDAVLKHKMPDHFGSDLESSLFPVRMEAEPMPISFESPSNFVSQPVTNGTSQGRRDFLKVSGTALLGGVAARSMAADDPAPQAPSTPDANIDRDPLLISDHPEIIKSRDLALQILKPTRQHLERGLQLHRRSLVFDSYGFSPRAAIDGDFLAERMAQGISDQEVQNLREEMSMTRAARVPREREEFLAAMTAAGVTCIFQNAGEEGNDPVRLLRRLAHFTYLGDHFGDGLKRATSPIDIRTAHSAGEHCLYLTGNGVPLPSVRTNVSEDLGLIRLFFELGIRMMHVTYNRRNLLGDGCAETANGGLSDFGRAAVAEMNRIGVIVDVAHSGWQTSLEAAQTSAKPMVASHTTCEGLFRHIRSKPDNVIKAICDTGGLIGICCIPSFLAGSGDIAMLIEHVDYVVRKFGADHVAIGTDAGHTSRYYNTEIRKLKSRGTRLPRFAALWPEGALGGNWPNSRSLAWTNWPLFTVGLVQKGYSDETIQKILGGNVLRVCEAALASPVSQIPDTRALP